MKGIMLGKVMLLIVIISLGMILISFMLMISKEVGKYICKKGEKKSKKNKKIKVDDYEYNYTYLCPVCNSSMTIQTSNKDTGEKVAVCENCDFNLLFTSRKDFEEYRKYYRERHKLSTIKSK